MEHPISIFFFQLKFSFQFFKVKQYLNVLSFKSYLNLIEYLVGSKECAFNMNKYLLLSLGERPQEKPNLPYSLISDF